MSDGNSTKTKKVCEFPGCNGKYHAHGLCAGHRQQQANGNALTVIKPRRPRGTPPIIRYTEQPCSEWGLSQGLTTPCHIFQGYIGENGYGQVGLNGKVVGVHVYVWEITNGKIEKGMMIDHVCHVRPCCNLGHLRNVTPKQNTTENVVGAVWQKNLDKTHCPHGHEYAPSNTYRNARGGRRCKICAKANAKSRKRRLRQERMATK